MKLDIKYSMLYDSIIYGILEKANYKVVKSLGVMHWDLGGRWWYEETVFGMLELFWMKVVVNIQLWICQNTWNCIPQRVIFNIYKLNKNLDGKIDEMTK